MLCSALLFSGVGAIVKATASELPIEVIVFFRNATAYAALLPYLLLVRRDVSLKTGCLGLHLVRAAAGLSAMYTFFIAVKLLRLADAMLLSYTLPIFIPIIERVWLGEPVTRRTQAAVALGFVGILLILKPGSGLFQPAGLVGLASGILAALAMVGIRRMAVSEPVDRIIFYFTTFGTAVSAVPLAWAWETPKGRSSGRWWPWGSSRSWPRCASRAGTAWRRPGRWGPATMATWCSRHCWVGFCGARPWTG